MKPHNRSAGWFGWVALTGLVASCAQILGIEDAYVDPSLSAEQETPQPEPAASSGLADASVAEPELPDGPQGGAQCVHFDNAARLSHLNSNGMLTPLPERAK